MDEKTVWLLGSGFSKPLGGPLLRDLFRQEREEDVAAFFSLESYPDLAQSLPWVQFCFQNGLREGLWDNAEQFLTYVDDGYRAREHGKLQRVIHLLRRYDLVPDNVQRMWADRDPSLLSAHKQYHHELPEHFYRRAKRALAAECSRFVSLNPWKLIPASYSLEGPREGPEHKSERWLPYREWIKSLRPGDDTVICFNYDLVIETAAEGAYQSEKMWVPLPSGSSQELIQPSNTVAVLKLHGSVDWRLRGDSPTPERTPAIEVLRSPDDDILIAAPGGSKSIFVGTHLDPLWKHAEEALKRADRLMVIGYSFPDTDPLAQHRLLHAFHQGTSPNRWAHVILGSEVSPTSRRMRSLLKSTSRSGVVKVMDFPERGVPATPFLGIVEHPLGTQDFIGRHESFTKPR